MMSVVHTAKKTVLVVFWLVLFFALLVFGAILFLALLQWFMHTELYLNMVGSLKFWKWGMGALVIFIITLYCISVK